MTRCTCTDDSPHCSHCNNRAAAAEFTNVPDYYADAQAAREQWGTS